MPRSAPTRSWTHALLFSIFLLSGALTGVGSSTADESDPPGTVGVSIGQTQLAAPTRSSDLPPLPANPLWVQRDRATKGTIAGGFFGALLGVAAARYVMSTAPEPTAPILYEGAYSGRQGNSRTLLGVGTGVAITFAIARLGHAIGARDVYWEPAVNSGSQESVPNSEEPGTPGAPRNGGAR